MIPLFMALSLPLFILTFSLPLDSLPPLCSVNSLDPSLLCPPSACLLFTVSPSFLSDHICSLFFYLYACHHPVFSQILVLLSFISTASRVLFQVFLTEDKRFKEMYCWMKEKKTYEDANSARNRLEATWNLIRQGQGSVGNLQWNNKAR